MVIVMCYDSQYKLYTPSVMNTSTSISSNVFKVILYFHFFSLNMIYFSLKSVQIKLGRPFFSCFVTKCSYFLSNLGKERTINYVL